MTIGALTIDGSFSDAGVSTDRESISWASFSPKSLQKEEDSVKNFFVSDKSTAHPRGKNPWVPE
jgi:hypothetical protein